MATFKIADFPSFINQQIQIQEQIELHLWKLDALVTIPLVTDDFYDALSEKILRNYFSIAHDLINASVQANKASLSELMKQIQCSINVNI